MRVIVKIYRRSVLNGAAIHGQYGVKGRYDRRAAVGLHDLAASISTAVLNGQADRHLESRRKFVFCCHFRRRQPEHGISRIKAAVIARAFAEGLAVQVQRDVALLQRYAGVVVMADGYIRQQLHRGAASLLCRRKRRVNVGVRRGLAVDGDLRHICGICLRRDVIFRLLRPHRRGQERQAQGQRHEHTQYSFFHIFPP